MTALRAAAGDNALTGAAVIEIVGDRLYYVLCTFIPALPEWLPEHEFNGYASPQAYEQDRYDEDEDKSPTFPQFLDAFDVIVEVNGGKRFLDMLGKVLDWDKIKTSLSTKASEWIEESSTPQPSLPGTSTESGPTSSTPTSPTPEPVDTPESQSANDQDPSIESGIPQPIGITLPVLFGLFDRYAERRQRELHEQAAYLGIGVNDPKQLQSLAPDSGRPDTDDEESEFETPVWKR
jgi:hypothetical protein